MTDPMLRYIDRVLREQEMYELKREMHANMLRVEQIIDDAAPALTCVDLNCEWCLMRTIRVVQENRNSNGEITVRHFTLTPRQWSTSFRNILPFRTKVKY